MNRYYILCTNKVSEAVYALDLSFDKAIEHYADMVKKGWDKVEFGRMIKQPIEKYKAIYNCSGEIVNKDIE